MSKKFFRWLRGELFSGYYLSNIHDTMNVTAQTNMDFLSKFKLMQFNLAMNKNTLYNIGKFASVFLPRKSTLEKLNSVRLSESYEENGEQYSERGLYDTENERFEYQTDIPSGTDINTRATPTLRSSLVGDSDPVEGYIASSNDDVFDSDGNIRPSAILPSPPVDEAYSDYFGNKFQFLSEGAESYYTDIVPELYIAIYKALQWIRYNGVSLKSLLNIADILCTKELLQINSVEVASDKRHYMVYYTYYEDSDVLNKEQRLFLFEYLVGLKFKQCELVQAIN